MCDEETSIPRNITNNYLRYDEVILLRVFFDKPRDANRGPSGRIFLSHTCDRFLFSSVEHL